MPQAKGRYDLSAPEIALPVAFATRFTGSKILSMLKRLGVCLAIAALRASTRGRTDIIASLTSSGNSSAVAGISVRARAILVRSASGTGTDERWVMGDEV